MSKKNIESDSGIVSPEWDALLTGALQSRIPETGSKQGALGRQTNTERSYLVKGLAVVFVVIVTLGLLLPSVYVGWLISVAVGSDWWAFAAGHLVALLSGGISIVAVSKIMKWVFGKNRKGA